MKYDDTFDTIKHGRHRIPSSWQTLAGFDLLKAYNRADIEQAFIPASENLGTDCTQVPVKSVATENEGDREMVGADNENDDQSVATTTMVEDELDKPRTYTRSGRNVRHPERYNDFVAYSIENWLARNDDSSEWIEPIVFSASMIQM